MSQLAAVTAGVVFLLSTPITAGVVRPRPLSIVFEIDDDYSVEAFDEMKAVLASLMSDAGLGIDFRELKNTTGAAVFARLVVVRFRGSCRIELPSPAVNASSVILALSHSTERAILPFAEVACDNVRAVVQYALGARTGHANRLFGRALARVLAHELYHISVRTFRHGRHGITRAALSGYELISDDLGFSAAELEELRISGSTDQNEPEVAGMQGAN
jgi:hypothetical protein